MGGGHLTRPGEYAARPDPSHPMTEFYLLLQNALDGRPTFALPGCRVRFTPPEGRVYAEDMPGCCRFTSAEEEGLPQVLPPRRLPVLHCHLAVARDGAPAALLLAEEGSRRNYAVRLLPPFAVGIALPPVPDAYAALRLAMTEQDVFLADAAPARLAARWVESPAGKEWLHHPAMEQWMQRALAVAQRSRNR